MPRFHFVKENGVTRMVEVDNAEIAAIPLVQPGGATLQAGTPRQRWVCVACHPESRRLDEQGVRLYEKRPRKCADCHARLAGAPGGHLQDPEGGEG